MIKSPAARIEESADVNFREWPPGVDAQKPIVSNSLRAKRFYVSGLVQGVGYRFFAERVAAQLGIGGYAKNLRDGRVEVYAVADTEVFAKLRQQLERGPRAANVSAVAEEDAQIDERYANEFTIEYES